MCVIITYFPTGEVGGAVGRDGFPKSSSYVGARNKLDYNQTSYRFN